MKSFSKDLCIVLFQKKKKNPPGKFPQSGFQEGFQEFFFSKDFIKPSTMNSLRISFRNSSRKSSSDSIIFARDSRRNSCMDFFRNLTKIFFRTSDSSPDSFSVFSDFFPGIISLIYSGIPSEISVEITCGKSSIDCFLMSCNDFIRNSFIDSCRNS